MVGRVTGNSAVVNLVTAEDLSATVQARVRWAETLEDVPGSPNVSPIISTSDSSARMVLEISGLQPNQKYFYQVEYETSDEPGVWVAMPQICEFHSQRTAGQSFSFCLVADPHWGHPNKVLPDSPQRWTGQQCLQRILEDEEFDFFVDLGDSAYPTRIESGEEALSRYADWRKVMADITRKMPAFVVLGNHEQEAGFFQKGTDDPPEYLWNELSSTQYHQKWATEARLRFVPNPRRDTYPEGGEGAPGYDTAAEWGAGTDPWNNGISSNIQNFYAWTWGDALFIVLDPCRYTLVGSTVFTTSPSEWTLGPTQMSWLQDVLAASTASWKFVIAHHQVGGGLIDVGGDSIEDGGTERAYARGSAVEADHPGTEQALIHQLMLQHGVQFFVYGHDHAFCDSVKDGIHYICCGRPTFLNPWWSHDGMLNSYGSILVQGQDKPWTRALWHVLGYAKFHVTPDKVTVQWIRTGYSFPKNVVPIEDAQRDWRESWLGKAYPVNEPPLSVNVAMIPTDVDGVRTVAGAVVSDFFEVPTSEDYYEQPDPVRPEDYDDTEVAISEGFPVEPGSPTYAVVDTVPELIYERSWLYRGDSDDDGDRDLVDYGAMQGCYSPEAGSVPEADPCTQMDLDGDQDVDSDDFADFMADFGGPG